MHKIKQQILSLGGLLTLCLSTTAQAVSESPLNLPIGVTPISRDIFHLHMMILWICVAIGAVVFGVLIYALVKHRKSKGHQAANFHSSVKIEIIWAVIPFILLVIMAIPATKVLQNMDDSDKPAINIKITGYQWKWQYEYLDSDISFFSSMPAGMWQQVKGEIPKEKWYLLEVDNPLVVPIHKKIRFLVTSNDVIHSWWVPALGIKRDAIPGFIHEAWARIEKPGIYRGQCAELCGVHHAYMPIVVKAVTEKEYEKWLAQKTNKPTASSEPAKPLTKDELMQLGEKVYATSCSVCHQADGKGLATFPSLVGSALSVGPKKAHIDIVLNGKTGTAMQAFGNQLTDEQIAAVVTYERNAWGNDNKTKYGKNAGGIVQPADVAAERK